MLNVVVLIVGFVPSIDTPITFENIIVIVLIAGFVPAKVLFIISVLFVTVETN